MTKHLNAAGLSAAAIHGNKSQNQRTRALDGFKSSETRILVATDIAARGIDVDGIEHVGNFELPNVPAFLDIARFLAPATLAGTVIFVMLDFFGERVRSIAVATLYRNHTVFVGRDARALIVAADIARDEKVVFALIEPDEEIEGGIAEIDALSIRCPLGTREAFAKTARIGFHDGLAGSKNGHAQARVRNFCSPAGRARASV